MRPKDAPKPIGNIIKELAEAGFSPVLTPIPSNTPDTGSMNSPSKTLNTKSKDGRPVTQQSKNMDDGTVEIHGKTYKTVALRIQEFLDGHEQTSIRTKVLYHDAERVGVKASVYIGGELVATGLAEEERGSSNINTTSALENAETSAVGRALAFCGYAGSEIASADEVANAIGQQGDKEVYNHIAAVRELFASVACIKKALQEEEFDLAKEAWQELSDDEKRALWRAPTKGGIFTTIEREQIREASNGSR